MWETLVNVLIDDVRFVQDQVALDQDGHLAIGIHDTDVFLFVEQVHVADLKIHAFFKQNEAATVRIRASGARVQNHHVGVSLIQKQWLASAETTQQATVNSTNADEKRLFTDYLTSFQKDAFKRQATTMKAAKNSITQTPMRTRVF